MNRYSRYDIFVQLLLHEKDSSVWQAEFTVPIFRQSFRIHDLISSTDLILQECNLSFALRCGCGSAQELVGRAINHFIIDDRVNDVTIQNDDHDRPYIITFRTGNDTADNNGTGYVNTVGLIADDTWIYAMVGRQYDMAPELKKHAEQLALQEKLTVKEFRVFLSLAKGHTVKHIAWNTGSTEKAVYYHIENIERKMKAQSIIGIVQQAYRLGFMDTG